ERSAWQVSCFAHSVRPPPRPLAPPALGLQHPIQPPRRGPDWPFSSSSFSSFLLPAPLGPQPRPALRLPRTAHRLDSARSREPAPSPCNADSYLAGLLIRLSDGLVCRNAHS